MPVPDLADSRAPYLQIADDLRAQIDRGDLAPGDKLPSIKAMAQQYACAPDTVRHALDELKGLVATQSTKGTYVLRRPSAPEPDPEFLKLASGMQDVLKRLDKVEERLAELEGQDRNEQR
jgi:DNA-binding GntR family transcriptional regulator